MKNNTKSTLKRALNSQELIVLLPLAVLCIAATLFNPNFLKPQNLGAMAKSLAPWGLLAIGETFIIISGQIDISIGSMVSLGTVFFANAMANWRLAFLPAVLLTMLLTVGLSAINGYFIIYREVPAFLSSIALLYICKGSANAMTNAKQIVLYTKELEDLAGNFLAFGQKEFLHINYAFVFFIVLCLVLQFVLKKTPFGRMVLATGDNENVAKVAGIHTKRIQLYTYLISGVFVALSALFVVGREGVGSPKYGEGWEMTVVAATAIGGISLVGGSGNLFGTMIGVFVMAVISNVLILFNVNQHFQSVILGIIIVLSVVMDVQRRNKLLGK